MERRQIPHQPFADRLLVTAQPIPEPAATTLEQLLVQRREARRPRHRHQQVPTDPADQPLDLAFVVAVAGPPKPVGKHVMRLQLAEHPCPLAHPIAQDARDRQLGVVVQDRARHLAEEAGRGIVSVTERFGGLRRISLHETGVAVRQVHCKEVDLALDPGDLRQRFTKIHLRMARIVTQRHEYLAMPQPPRQHVVFHNGDPAGVAVLVAKPFEDPLRGMPLLPRPTLILQQDPLDDPGERVELRTRRRPASPVPGRYRKRQHLRTRPRIDAKTPRCFPPAHTFNLNRITNLSIELHALHPPAPAAVRQRLSAAGFLLRRNRTARPLHEGSFLRRLHTEKTSCWTGCALYGKGCYAFFGALGHFWSGVSEGTRGGSWDELCAKVAALPKMVYRGG